MCFGRDDKIDPALQPCVLATVMIYTNRYCHQMNVTCDARHFAPGAPHMLDRQTRMDIHARTRTQARKFRSHSGSRLIRVLLACGSRPCFWQCHATGGAEGAAEAGGHLRGCSGRLPDRCGHRAASPSPPIFSGSGMGRDGPLFRASRAAAGAAVSASWQRRGGCGVRLLFAVPLHLLQSLSKKNRTRLTLAYLHKHSRAHIHSHKCIHTHVVRKYTTTFS